MRKRRLYVLAATMLLAVGGASYALAAHGDRHGPGPGNGPHVQGFHATLSGLQETPANFTTGSGEFDATLDPSAPTPTIHYVFSYSHLKGQLVTNGKVLFAHVHFGQPNVAGGVSFFLCDNSAAHASPNTCPDDGSGSGTVEGDITAANVIGPNAQGIEPGSFGEFVRAMQAGVAYANIHTTRWPSGEIRGEINANGDDD